MNRRAPNRHTGSLRQPAEQLRSELATALAGARRQVEELRAELEVSRRRQRELFAERNALLKELSRVDLLREALRQAEARDRAQRSERKLLESSEAGLQLEVEELKRRCEALESELKSERARRAAAEEAQAAAEEENEELRPLLDLVELATRDR